MREGRTLAADPAVHGVAEAALGPGAFAVRGILFDKTPGANWTVVWHPDLTIAVRERRDVPGFGPWTEKDDVPEVVCTVPRGGALAFHSILLHASSPARELAHRRVVHLEYVAAEWAELPGGVAWYERP